MILLSLWNGIFSSVVTEKTSLALTRYSVSTRKREGGFFCLVIPNIFNHESILSPTQMDPRLKLAGMPKGEMDTPHKLQA